MPEKLPIDVIIPAWGEAYTKNLPRALDSVSAAATRTIVGDETTRTFAMSHGANRALELTVKHPGPARVQGLTTSTQPYVLFLDADDALLPGGLEKLYNTLENIPSQLQPQGTSNAATTPDSGRQPTRRAWQYPPSGCTRYCSATCYR